MKIPRLLSKNLSLVRVTGPLGTLSLSLSFFSCSTAYIIMCACSVTQSHPTLCDPMDCSLPGSSLPGILQARILEWVAVPFSRRSSPPRDRAQVFCVSCIGSWVLYHWSYLWNSNTLATWCEELTHGKRPGYWERLKVGGKQDNRGWDGWMHHWLDGHESE